VREQTQELASWALGDSPRSRSAFPQGYLSDNESENRRQGASTISEGGRTSLDSARPDIIEEEESSSVEDHERQNTTVSALTNLFRPKKQPLPRASFSARAKGTRPAGNGPDIAVEDVDTGEVTEVTALLSPNGTRDPEYGAAGPRKSSKGKWDKFQSSLNDTWEQVKRPERWDLKAMLAIGMGALSAVFLGVLLNVLDALSYGMILFPLGETIFENTGPDGISMFYVSCIVSQLTYSLGGSGFSGGVGSEMIEVVPFFHKMAYMILAHIGDDDPESVMATVITSYALSSILTGIIFILLGALRLGDLVSFFPRSILLGCIGGVGVFLFLTGIEVSAGLDSSLGWGPSTLKRLVTPSTFVLWSIPLLLSVTLMFIRHHVHHPVVMPAFFIFVVAIFYLVVNVAPNLNLPLLRENGWIFAAPASGVPFYNFYSYYNFSKINWEALSQTVPTMFALSFFGIIHVPINVPALGIAVQEDDVHINRELFGHGVSNAVSGLLGSIQNYLVFANSRLFIQNGGNSRWAGVLLAVATTGVWIAGPAMIGFIPIMIVGTLIFMLGIEMAQEALWDTFGKLQTLEYLMVLAITLVMGFYDFVAGIVLGIVLTCLIFVVQNSRISAIRATFSGTVVESTVRRHPAHRRFLHEVGSQIKIVKLSGYLFFGSIVAVEKEVRKLIENESFSKQPIRYLIIDFIHVGGLDFSAAEAFVRMNRILRGRDVELILSGISFSDEIGKSLIMVGLLENEPSEDSDPPRVFEDLNQALEACENELLFAFKLRSEQVAKDAESHLQISSMSIPPSNPRLDISSDFQQNSPRRTQVAEATTTTLREHDIAIPAKWASFAQPLPLILQAFKDATSKDYEFWHRVVPYFTRLSFPTGGVLFRRGDKPDGLYLLEEGILRADHELEQGRYSESIVAGTTVGELPFFAETNRNATVVADKDCVVWLLSRANWDKLEKEAPDVATEMLRVGLKLTSERINSITS
jgi:SulP family sulfate permease